MSTLLENGFVADFRFLAPSAALFALAAVLLIVRRLLTRRTEREDLPPGR